MPASAGRADTAGRPDSPASCDHPGSSDSTASAAALDRGVTAVDRALRAHRGGAELVHRGADGEVVLRLTGMCTGCVFWPATVAGTIRPLLEHSLGEPVSVSIEGRRVSEAAMRRLAALGPPPELREHLTC